MVELGEKMRKRGGVGQGGSLEGAGLRQRRVQPRGGGVGEATVGLAKGTPAVHLDCGSQHC